MLHDNIRLDCLLVLEPPGEKVVDPLIIVFRILYVIGYLFSESPLFIVRFRQVPINFGCVEDPSVFCVGSHWTEINLDAVIVLVKLISG